MSSWAYADELQCRDLFPAVTPVSHLAGVPLPFVRFVKPLSASDLEASPHLRFWWDKINKSTHWFPWYFLDHKPKDVFSEFFLSKDGLHIIGHSSNHILYVYETSTRRLVKEINLYDLGIAHTGYLLRIVSVANNHLIVASEESTRLQNDLQMDVHRFFPSQLWVLNFAGDVLITQLLEQVLKMATLNEQEDSLLVMEADHLGWETFPERSEFYLGHIMYQVQAQFVNGANFIFQSFLLSDDGRSLYIGAISRHGRESRVALLDLSRKTSPQVVWSVATPLEKIYAIEKSGNDVVVTGLSSSPKAIVEWVLTPPQ